MPDITRDTIESLSEKLETFVGSLPPAERAVVMTALSPHGTDTSAYASFGAGLPALLAAAIGLKPGTSIASSQVAGRTAFVQMKAAVRSAKV
jgi:hypothetical protein